MALTQVSTGGIKDGQVQTADIADAQITAGKLHADALDRTYTLGADGTNHYTFTGEGLTGAVNDPTLYLTRGKTYRFVNGNSSGAHPFRIQTTVNGSAGTEYNTGVTNNGGAGGSTIIFEVPHAAPDVLYYQCTSHNGMGGVFYITGALADGGVTEAKLGAASVTTAKINDSAVTAVKIASDAVTTVKIQDDAVTQPKIGALAVGTTELSDAAATTDKIADLNVTTAKIAADAVTGAKIADDSIDSEHYADGSIDTAHIADAQITDAKIASGISSSKLTGALPAISGASLTGIAAGITEADIWRMTANLQGSSSAAVITSNLSRGSDNTYVGTGMTESSGEFTFPSTGKWLIYVQVTAYGQYAYGKCTIGTQVDSPAGYNTVAHAVCNVSQNGGYGGGSSMAIVDIENTLYKARFWQQTSSTSGRFLHGDANHNVTAFTFIRLADT